MPKRPRPLRAAPVRGNRRCRCHRERFNRCRVENPLCMKRGLATRQASRKATRAGLILVTAKVAAIDGKPIVQIARRLAHGRRQPAQRLRATAAVDHDCAKGHGTCAVTALNAQLRGGLCQTARPAGSKADRGAAESRGHLYAMHCSQDVPQTSRLRFALRSA